MKASAADPAPLAILKERLSGHDIRWLLGAAGAGKSTTAGILAGRYGLQLIDLDTRIYGEWHHRFSPTRHPANHEWTSAPSSLEWLLSMEWSGYDQFQRAALVEYLDLLAEDMGPKPGGPVLIDGGVYHPALLAEALPSDRIVCLARPQLSAREVWESTEERRAMRDFMSSLPDPGAAWARFLDFDERIEQTVAQEAAAVGLALIERKVGETITTTVEAVAGAFGLGGPLPSHR